MEFSGLANTDFMFSEYRRYVIAYYQQLISNGSSLDFYHGCVLGIELSFMWIGVNSADVEKIKSEIRSEMGLK